MLVAEREPESSEEEKSGMSAATVSQAYLPNTGSAYTQHYEDVRTASERLAVPLSPEDYQVQSMPDASSIKWHLG